MKTLPLLAPLCFTMLFGVAVAQEPSAEQTQIEKQLRYLLSPIQRLEWEAEKLAPWRSTWNGYGTWMTFRAIMVHGGENELGLTDEQKQRFSFRYQRGAEGDGVETNWFDEMSKNPTPEYTQAEEAYKAVYFPLRESDTLLERVTEEQKNAYREVAAFEWNLFYAAQHKEIVEILTPEQLTQVRKLEMQLMPAVGFPFPSMFEPLELTEEQKEEMNKITKEMKAEFDQLVLEIAIYESGERQSRYETLRGKSFASKEEFWKARSEAARTVTPQSRESQRKNFADWSERGIKLATTLQSRLMNVLTDEQLDEMQKILDETPMFVKKFIAGFKMLQAAAKMSPGYVPGPDSWRPGDPLPVQFKEERKTGRFPRVNQSE